MHRRIQKPLSEADIALWWQVARSVTPMPGRALPPLQEAAKPAAASVMESAPVMHLAPSAKPVLPALAPLERRLRTQLRRGAQSVEAVIDLHGMRQDAAHTALHAFLRREQARGTRIALVITGKGAAGDAIFGEERGVLRRIVPHWLRMPDLRPFVVGFEEAEQRHGGAGALYIRLRRGAGR